MGSGGSTTSGVATSGSTTGSGVTTGSPGGSGDSRSLSAMGSGTGSLMNSISKGGVTGGGVIGFMVIFANPKPTNPCKTAAIEIANTLIFLELST